MDKVISSQPEWETKLAPRLLLGLWHPRFLSSANTHLPYCRRSYLGVSPYIARKYFWNDVDTFSMQFNALATMEGQKFMTDCKAAGKKLLVWTVNEPEHMMEAVRWGVDAILTDFTQRWLDMRVALYSDYDKTGSKYGRYFLWTTPWCYSPFQYVLSWKVQKNLEKIAGPFDAIAPVEVTV